MTGRLPSIALVAVLAALAPSDAVAQFEMPDAKQMSGVPMPAGDLPAGTLTVRLVRGQLSNNIVGHPVELQIGGKTLTVKTDESGRAVFTSLAPGSAARAAAVVDGERLESQEVTIPASGGTRMLLVATAPAGAGAASAKPIPGTVVLGGQSRFVLEVGEDAVEVYGLIQVMNTARAPVEPAAPLVFEMPTGAQGTSVLQGSSPQARASGPRVTVVGPFNPGSTLVQFAYQLPFASDRLTISHVLPATLEQVSFAAKKLGALEIHSPNFASHQEVAPDGNDGEPFIMATGPTIPAGGRLTLELSGLPHHSPIPRYVALALALLVLSVGGWVAAAPGASGASARRTRLGERRDRIFADLVRLEEQRRAGQIAGGRYAARRRDLVQQLERIYGELDSSGPGLDASDRGLAA